MAALTYTVSKEGGVVVITPSEGKVICKPLGSVSASSDGIYVIITNANNTGEEIVRAAYSNFTSPTAGSASALRTILNTSFLFNTTNEGGINSTPVTIEGPSSAFGEILHAQNEPHVSGDFVYGINSRVWEQFTATGGSVTAADGKATCQTGTNLYGYGLIRTVRPLVYRPGRGLSARYTARFSTPVALGAQRAGLIESDNELSFGYDGVNFGILRRTNGAQEIQTLTVSVAAGGAETATITLAGDNFNVPVTAGTVQQNAAEIAAGSFTGWTAHQLDDTVIFVASAVGDKTGLFGLTSTGSCAGSFAETRAGATPSDNWTYQTDWNIDKMDGNGTSGMTLDPSKFNVFQIDLQYLGAGAITFFIEDSETGRFQAVHRIKYANSSDEVHVRNPSFRIGWFAASLGSTTNITTEGASCAGFVQGFADHGYPAWTFQNIKTSIGTTPTAIFNLKVAPEFGGIANNSKVEFLLGEGSSALSGNNTGALLIYENTTETGGTRNWQQVDADSSVWYDTSGTTFSGGILLAALPLQKNGGGTINLKELAIESSRGKTITFAAVANGGSGEFEFSATWNELV